MVSFNPFDPQSALLLGLGQGLMQGGGWSTMPTTFGQAAGAGLQQGMTNYYQAIREKRAQDQADLQRALIEAQTGKLEREGAQAQRINDYIATLPPEDQELARAFPQLYAKAATAPAPEQWVPLAPDVAQNYPDLDPSKTYQISTKTGQVKPVGGSLVQVDTGRAEEYSLKREADYRKSLVEGSDAARRSLGSIRRFRSLLERGDFETSRLGPLKLALGGYMRAFGEDPEDYGLGNVETGEQLAALSRDFVLGKISQATFGALSEGEREFLAESTASERLTPEANIALLNIAENAARRSLEKRQMYDRWITEYGSDRARNPEGLNFLDAWDAYVEADAKANPYNPEQEAAEAPEETVEPPAEAGVVPAPTDPQQRVTVTKDTDLRTLPRQQAIQIPLNTLTPEQRKQMEEILTDMGF